MAISKAVKDRKVKITAKDKSTQTVSNCKTDATADQLYKIGSAVSKLMNSSTQEITGITESVLVLE